MLQSQNPRISLAIALSAFCLTVSFGYVSAQEGTAMTASPSVKYPSKPPTIPRVNEAVVRFEERAQWGVYNTHDPAGIYAEGTYYVYSTDVMMGYGGKDIPRRGIQIRKSKDLVNWEFVGWVLDDIPEAALKHAPRAGGMWAPDILKVGDTYRLYYCVSEFGRKQSYIGFATSKSPEGPWSDQGEVYKTFHDDDKVHVNALDPGIVVDKQGRHWMTYGSYFAGMYIMQLDAGTGKPVAEGPGTRIVQRADARNGIEAPYIIYNAKFDKYYLFVSYDWLATTYNVQVARSDKAEGPYYDHAGNAMADPTDSGVKVLGSYAFAGDEGWMGPGHNGIIEKGEDYYMVHHVRAPDWIHLHVRKMVWTDDGWPMVSPERFAGEEEQAIPKEMIPGSWEYIVHLPDNIEKQSSRTMTLTEDGNFSLHEEQGKWKAKGDKGLEFQWSSGAQAQVKLLPAWDWEKDKPTLVFMGLTEKGVAFWGKKVASS
jgi:arabinan endo-1,5-alpha-L-arabinosidase